jgi:hypothetical protein
MIDGKNYELTDREREEFDIYVKLASKKNLVDGDFMDTLFESHTNRRNNNYTPQEMREKDAVNKRNALISEKFLFYIDSNDAIEDKVKERIKLILQQKNSLADFGSPASASDYFIKADKVRG